MNRTKIEWADYTWNPVTGCLRGCPYCYAKKQALRFASDVRMNLMDPRCIGDKNNMLFVLDAPYTTKNNRCLSEPFGFYPTLHTYRLKKPGELKTGEGIFVCSMADLFGDWVPEDWILRVFAACMTYPQHNYLFLTKYPQRYQELLNKGLLPSASNFWYGSTATCTTSDVFTSNKVNTFVSIEPILEPIAGTFSVNWVIIGAETGNRKGKVIPERSWIKNLVEAYHNASIPVFLKNSLSNIMQDDLIQERPSSLQLHPISEKLRAKLWDTCCVCKQEKPMKEMIALLYRERRGESAKKLGYACPSCFNHLQKHLQSDNPLSIAVTP